MPALLLCPNSLKTKMAETLAIPPMKGGAIAAERALVSRLDEHEHQAYSSVGTALSC